ncbi:MAG: hypothetical protein R3Y63_02600 [Eubacteriales bacterium]
MDKLLQNIIALILIVVAIRVILFLVGITLSIIGDLLVLAICIGGIVLAVNFFQERK